MQDGYAGDVSDFGKYGLLNQLCSADGCGGPALSLGVLWHVPCHRCVAEESATQNDGEKTAYLQPGKCQEFRQCDPDLWERMRSLVRGRRSIAAVERSGALPAGTKYYSKPQVCGFHQSYATQADKEERRRTWLRAGRDTVKGTDLVFVDPDNGFEPKSVDRHRKGGPKYVYYDDLGAHLKSGQSLVVYQDLARRKVPEQVIELLNTVSKRFDLGKRAFAVRFRRRTSVAFLVLPSPTHSDLLSDRAQQLVDSPWGELFDRCIYRPRPKPQVRASC